MSKKGVTVIEMVVVVVILILLAIMAIWSAQRPSAEAEAAVIYSELRSVYLGVSKIKSEYESMTIDEYTAGEQFCEEYKEDGEAVEGWYVIYGLDDVTKYDENVLNNYGVAELKRSYKVNFDTGEVEFLNGPVKVGEYEVNSYDQIKQLMDSGVI